MNFFEGPLMKPPQSYRSKRNDKSLPSKKLQFNFFLHIMRTKNYLRSTIPKARYSTPSSDAYTQKLSGYKKTKLRIK